MQGPSRAAENDNSAVTASWPLQAACPAASLDVQPQGSPEALLCTAWGVHCAEQCRGRCQASHLHGQLLLPAVQPCTGQCLQRQRLLVLAPGGTPTPPRHLHAGPCRWERPIAVLDKTFDWLVLLPRVCSHHTAAGSMCLARRCGQQPAKCSTELAAGRGRGMCVCFFRAFLQPRAAQAMEGEGCHPRVEGSN